MVVSEIEVLLLDEKEIKRIVSMTVDDLTDKKMLRSCDDDLVYRFMSMQLRKHYHEHKSDIVENAIACVQNDPYLKIIPMYYKNDMTITAIAVELACDRATVSRNKKRIVMQIYDVCYGE